MIPGVFRSDILLRVLVIFSLLLLTACQGMPGKEADTTDLKDTPAADTVEKKVVVELPFKEPEAKTVELDSELIYNALLGEIANQRGDMELAYESYLSAARQAGDAKSAERATRIAIYLKKNELALEAVRLWVDLAPNDLTARQLAAMLYMEAGDDESVLEHLKAVVSISQATGSDGFVHAISALSRNQDAERVVALMRRLAEAFPGDAEAEYAVVLAASVMKQQELAEQEAVRLIKNYPELEKGYVLLSRIQISRGDKSAARQVLGEAVASHPSSVLLRSAYGRLLIDLKEINTAYAQFQELNRLSPDQPEILLSLGVLALQQEKSDEARRYFQQNLEIAPKSNEAAYYMGRIEEIEGNNEAAADWYKRVDSGDLQYEAQLRIARLLATGGSLAEARDALKTLRIRFPKHSVELYLMEAEMIKEHGDPNESMAVYDQGLTAHPDDLDLLYARALHSATIGRVDILERDLESVLAKDPDHADALNALGYTLADQTERYDEALRYIERALVLKPESPAILDSMGWVQFRLGNTERALEYLKRAIDLMYDSEITAHLGEVLWTLGDRDEARKVWDEALEKDPENSYLLDTVKRLNN